MLRRVMPGGLEAKASVDEAIDRCASSIGNLREDILRCKTTAEDKGADGEPATTTAPSISCLVWAPPSRRGRVECRCTAGLARAKTRLCQV